MQFQRILVAVDFSPPSREALEVAAKLTADLGAELTVAYVWQSPLAGSEQPVPAGAVEQMFEQANRNLTEWTKEASRLSGHAALNVFLHGAPWDEIVRTLERQAFDLAVVGTRGRTGLRHVLLGSVAEKVVRHAPCPVLVVRSRKPADERA